MRHFIIILKDLDHVPFKSGRWTADYSEKVIIADVSDEKDSEIVRAEIEQTLKRTKYNFQIESLKEVNKDSEEYKAVRDEQAAYWTDHKPKRNERKK